MSEYQQFVTPDAPVGQFVPLVGTETRQGSMWKEDESRFQRWNGAAWENIPKFIASDANTTVTGLISFNRATPPFAIEGAGQSGFVPQTVPGLSSEYVDGKRIAEYLPLLDGNYSAIRYDDLFGDFQYYNSATRAWDNVDVIATDLSSGVESEIRDMIRMIVSELVESWALGGGGRVPRNRLPVDIGANVDIIGGDGIDVTNPQPSVYQVAADSSLARDSEIPVVPTYVEGLNITIAPGPGDVRIISATGGVGPPGDEGPIGPPGPASPGSNFVEGANIDFTPGPGDIIIISATGGVGPPGSIGAPGDEGPIGPPGPASPGSNFVEGANIDFTPGPGDIIIISATGGIGPPGSMGAPGDEGPIGPTGPTGPIGPSPTITTSRTPGGLELFINGVSQGNLPGGPPGPPGSTGARGPTGARGATGPPGSTGARGPAGGQGQPGPPGSDRLEHEGLRGPEELRDPQGQLEHEVLQVAKVNRGLPDRLEHEVLRDPQGQLEQLVHEALLE